MANEVNDQGNPDPSSASKPTGSSDGQGTSLDGMRGVNPAFGEMDDQNAVEGPSASDAPDALGQMLGTDTPAEEDDGQEETDGPTDGDGQPQAQLSEAEVDDDVAALQGRLLASDKDRTKRAQEAAFMKGKLTELDPFIQLGIAVRENPQLNAYVDAVLQGQEPTGGQAKEAGKVAKAAGMTPDQFLQTVVQQVTSNVTQQVQQTLQSDAAASRQFGKIDKRAREELKHYDALQQHPAFLGWVSSMNMAIDNGTLLVPDGEDPNYHAIAKAHDVMIATNPDYIKAVHSAGVKKGKASTAKKLAGAAVSGSSRGSTQVKPGELTQDQKDRVGMLQAYLKGGTGRRLPGAR